MIFISLLYIGSVLQCLFIAFLPLIASLLPWHHFFVNFLNSLKKKNLFHGSLNLSCWFWDMLFNFSIRMYYFLSTYKFHYSQTNNITILKVSINSRLSWSFTARGSVQGGPPRVLGVKHSFISFLRLAAVICSGEAHENKWPVINYLPGCSYHLLYLHEIG